MAIVLRRLVGQAIGLYDPRTNACLYIEKAFDITDDCRGNQAERLLLLYAMDTTGNTIVQIRDCEPGQDNGAGVHFFLDDVSNANKRLIRLSFSWGFMLDRFCQLAHSLA